MMAEGETSGDAGTEDLSAWKPLRAQPHIAQAVIIWTLREWGMSSAKAVSLSLAIVRDLREVVSDLDGDGLVIDDDGFLARLRCVSRLAGEYVLVSDEEEV